MLFLQSFCCTPLLPFCTLAVATYRFEWFSQGNEKEPVATRTMIRMDDGRASNVGLLHSMYFHIYMNISISNPTACHLHYSSLYHLIYVSNLFYYVGFVLCAVWYNVLVIWSSHHHPLTCYQQSLPINHLQQLGVLHVCHNQTLPTFFEIT